MYIKAINNHLCAVDIFQQLLALEAKYGPPPQHTAAIEQIVDYYKQVHIDIFKLNLHVGICA